MPVNHTPPQCRFLFGLWLFFRRVAAIRIRGALCLSRRALRQEMQRSELQVRPWLRATSLGVGISHLADGGGCFAPGVGGWKTVEPRAAPKNEWWKWMKLVDVGRNSVAPEDVRSRGEGPGEHSLFLTKESQLKGLANNQNLPCANRLLSSNQCSRMLPACSPGDARL